MSQMHSHGPGQPSHSHGPPPPQQQQQPQQQQVQVRADPALQAAIDAQFTEVPIAFGSEPYLAVCRDHKLEKCPQCGVDFASMNRISRSFAQNPHFKCTPPPGNPPSKNLTQAVTNMKDEGNQFFKMNNHQMAIGRYSQSAGVAAQRPLWEPAKAMVEEISVALSNRSASHLSLHDYLSALADAEAVIQIRRNWAKGYIRKSKALVGLKQFKEAGEAAKSGLTYDPSNTELLACVKDSERILTKGTSGENSA